jgi:hypothetical protein
LLSLIIMQRVSTLVDITAKHYQANATQKA